jgi:hypothetical protein
MQLHTLLRNGSPLSALFSVASALFLSPRGWYPPVHVICATQRLYPLWLHSIAHPSCHHGGVECVSLAFTAPQVLRTKLRL